MSHLLLAIHVQTPPGTYGRHIIQHSRDRRGESSPSTGDKTANSCYSWESAVLPAVNAAALGAMTAAKHEIPHSANCGHPPRAVSIAAIAGALEAHVTFASSRLISDLDSAHHCLEESWPLLGTLPRAALTQEPPSIGPWL